MYTLCAEWQCEPVFGSLKLSLIHWIPKKGLIHLANCLSVFTLYMKHTKSQNRHHASSISEQFKVESLLLLCLYTCFIEEIRKIMEVEEIIANPSIITNSCNKMVLIYFKVNSKTVPWFSPKHKEGNKLCIIHPLIYGSVLITFTARVTKQHPVNISFLKN